MGLINGVATAIITPFKNGKVNYPEFFKLIDRQIDNGIKALVIIGTTGEPSTMADDEKREVIEKATAYINKRATVIAGTGLNNTREVIENSLHAQSCGVDGLLIVTPYYNKCTQNGLISFYKEVCAAVNIPVIAYNVPGRTGVNLSPNVAYEISKIPNLDGIKEASGNMEQILEIALKIKGNAELYCGDDSLIIPCLSVGAAGCISVVSNIIPKEYQEVFDKYSSGETKQALQLFERILPVCKSMFYEVNPIPVKAAAHLIGFDTEEIRSPLTIIEDENLVKLKTVLKNFGFDNKD